MHTFLYGVGVCLCCGQRVMTTTTRVITVGFITATDRAASKTQSVCVSVCMQCLDRPSTKMASKDYTLTGMK